MRVLTPTYQATLHAAVQSYINLFELNVFSIFFFKFQQILTTCLHSYKHTLHKSLHFKLYK